MAKHYHSLAEEIVEKPLLASAALKRTKWLFHELIYTSHPVSRFVSMVIS